MGMVSDIESGREPRPGALIIEEEPMATTSRRSADREVDYPTSDGKPMGETDLHRDEMMDLI